MTLALAFWILMLIWLVFGLYLGYIGRAQPAPPYHFFLGSNLLLFILLLLLGWGVFGPPLHG